MKKRTSRTWKGIVLLGLAAWGSLASAASCSPLETHRSERVKHPAAPSPPLEPEVEPEPPLEPLDSPEPSSPPPGPTWVPRREWSMSDVYDLDLKVKLSPLEKSIMDDCPERAWSKNVPKRSCATDGQCGDGFCDRGRCAAQWTCNTNYGERCEEDYHCGPRRCIDGRCRSCTGDTECTSRHRQLDESKFRCIEDDQLPGARWCSDYHPPPPVAPTPSAPSVQRPPPSEDYERRSGLKLSPLEKSIMDNCPERAWSKNVPKRTCTKDGQCGDGFCDRGHCAALWTCGERYGLSCKNNDQCDFYPCIDGRCRSCAAVADCAWRQPMTYASDVMCRPSSLPGARMCMVTIGSGMPQVGKREP